MGQLAWCQLPKGSTERLRVSVRSRACLTRMPRDQCRPYSPFVVSSPPPELGGPCVQQEICGPVWAFEAGELLRGL